MYDLTSVFQFFRTILSCVPSAVIKLLYSLAMFSFFLYIGGKFKGD